jgi:hypothetical protein
MNNVYDQALRDPWVKQVDEQVIPQMENMSEQIGVSRGKLANELELCDYEKACEYAEDALTRLFL